ncbi:MAG: hypothetical protein D6706_22170 [Chloroflexi bacterium]|nr:MAG: hypothetical protein D6706_22170 [Chloroflexota bacterium]
MFSLSSLSTRIRHLFLLVRALPLLRHRENRILLAEMRRFCRHLPVLLENSIPEAMSMVTPHEKRPFLPDETTTRHLADLAAVLERKSPLGLCLRRSLVRYHYLRQLGLPLILRFGAKLTHANQQPSLTGHAWLTLNNRPYFEPEENWREFTVTLSWPPG